MTRIPNVQPGVDEWSCTQCSRKLLLRRPPAFEKVVLDRGDEQAAHVGGSGIQPGRGPAAEPAGGGALARAERSWLREHGIDW